MSAIASISKYKSARHIEMANPREQVPFHFRSLRRTLSYIYTENTAVCIHVCFVHDVRAWTNARGGVLVVFLLGFLFPAGHSPRIKSVPPGGQTACIISLPVFAQQLGKCAPHSSLRLSKRANRPTAERKWENRSIKRGDENRPLMFNVTN
jgi:hypothetical protein